MTDEELKECRQFKQARIRYNMSQKECAERTASATALLKRLKKTPQNVQKRQNSKYRNFLKAIRPESWAMESLAGMGCKLMSYMPCLSAAWIKFQKIIHTVWLHSVHMPCRLCCPAHFYL